MKGLYTSGDWHVKEGSADAFIDAWKELADWTISSVPGCTFAKLLRDQGDPNHFVSFSPWRDESAVAAWRGLPGFGERVGRLQDLLREFTPRMMTVVGEAGPATPDPWSSNRYQPICGRPVRRRCAGSWLPERVRLGGEAQASVWR